MRLDQLLDTLELEGSVAKADSEIDAALSPLKTEILPVGITNYDLAVISSYCGNDIGELMEISTSSVARSLGLNLSYVDKAFDRFAALDIVKKVEEDKYTMQREIRIVLKKRTSVVMLSEHARHYLAMNAPADLFSKMGEWALERPYLGREISTIASVKSPFVKGPKK